MSNFSWLTSSIGRKVTSSLTGLFLCLFLVGHLIGNLQLVLPHISGASIQEVQLGFNEYAKFMTTFPAVKILSYLTYFSILYHAIIGFYLTKKNRAARPVSYSKMNGGANSTWSSRNMAVLGSIILIFIIIHMKSFWAEMHFGDLSPDANGNKDLFTIVSDAFQQLWYVVLYLIAMGAIAYHLLHGFKSGFQSLGLNHPKYTPLVEKAGLGFAIVVPVLFAIIPIYVYLAY